VCSEADEMALI